MLIDFSQMEETVIPNFLGGEGAVRAKMRVDELGKILLGSSRALPSGSTPTRPAARSSTSWPGPGGCSMTAGTSPSPPGAATTAPRATPTA